MLRMITFFVLIVAPMNVFGARVAVIRDTDAAIYSKVVLGIGVELSEPFAEYSLQGDVTRGAKVVSTAIDNGAQIIIAVGPKSAMAAVKETRASLIYCLVPRVEDYDLDRVNAVGIRLEVPYSKQMSVLKSINPSIKSVGIVADKDLSSDLMSRLKRDANVNGINIHVAHVKIAAHVSGVLFGLSEKLDALLLVSDPVALNVTSFDAMTEFARAKKIPFMALDDGFVARGALLSFAIDYGLTGRQAASIANRVLDESISLKDMRIMEHEGLNLAVNMKVANELYNDGPFFKNLLQIAADQRYGVEVF